MEKQITSPASVIAKILRLAAEGKLNASLGEYLQAEERLLERLKNFKEAVFPDCQGNEGQGATECRF